MSGIGSFHNCLDEFFFPDAQMKTASEQWVRKEYFCLWQLGQGEGVPRDGGGEAETSEKDFSCFSISHL